MLYFNGKFVYFDDFNEKLMKKLAILKKKVILAFHILYSLSAHLKCLY